MVDPDLGTRPIVLASSEWGTILKAIRDAEQGAADAYASLEQARTAAQSASSALTASLNNLTSEQNALASKISDADKAASSLVGQQEKVDRLERELSDLQNAARTLKEKFGEGSDAYREMKAALDQKTAEISNEKNKLALISNQVSNADAAVAESKKKVDSAAQTLAAAVANKIKAEQAAEKAQQNFDAAKANADNPTVTLGGKTAALSQEAAARGIAEAEAQVAAATRAADAAEAAAGDSLNQLSTISSKIEELTQKINAIAAAEESGGLDYQMDKLMKVTEVNGDAITAEASAKKELTAAQDNKRTADAALSLANQNYDNALSAKNTAERALSTASTALTSAQDAYNSAVAEFGEGSSEAAAANSSLQAAETGKTDAQNKLNQATSNLNTAASNKSTAQTAANSAKSVMDSAAQTWSTKVSELSSSQAVMDEQNKLVQNMQTGVLKWADEIAALELQRARVELAAGDKLELLNAAEEKLMNANSNLAEQKFWASNPSGSYTTSIAGIIGAKTADKITGYKTFGSIWQDSSVKIQSPVTISFNNKGDYLAGSDNWRKEDNRIPKLSAMRSVNLDTQGNKMWEWIGPTEGLLVWNPKDQRVFQPTGAEFFGEFTWGKRWSDGYKPLQALDKNKDSQLQGEELRGIWVWLDANIDAVVQDGELQTLADAGVDRLSLRVETDERGGMWVPEGASGKKGTFPTRDWWSMGGMSFKDYDDLVDLVRNTPSLWVWEPNNPDNDQQGGGLGFYASKDYGMIALSVPKRDPAAIAFAEALDAKNPESTITQYVFNVRDLGMDTFRWEADMGFGLLSTVVKTDGSDTITGSTKIVDKENSKPLEAAMWTGRRVSGPGLNEIADVANVSPNYNR
jgi:chromosome segregation ATPase